MKHNLDCNFSMFNFFNTSENIISVQKFFCFVRNYNQLSAENCRKLYNTDILTNDS